MPPLTPGGPALPLPFKSHVASVLGRGCKVLAMGGRNLVDSFHGRDGGSFVKPRSCWINYNAQQPPPAEEGRGQPQLLRSAPPHAWTPPTVLPASPLGANTKSRGDICSPDHLRHQTVLCFLGWVGVEFARGPLELWDTPPETGGSVGNVGPSFLPPPQANIGSTPTRAVPGTPSGSTATSRREGRPASSPAGSPER